MSNNPSILTTVFGPDPEEGVLDQITNCRGEFCALMADNHLGYSQPIGGVVAYRDKISPSGVGYDIGCGNKASLLDVNYAQIEGRVEEIMDEVFDSLSFGLGGVNPEPVEHVLFDEDPAWDIDFVADLKDLARRQLGSIGSGNHYVDIFIDLGGKVWVGCHFGSRGLGHNIATEFVKRAGGSQSMMAEPVLLDVDSQDGQEYIAAMELAGRYAYAGRDWVCQKVAQIIGGKEINSVHNNHNFAWREQHFGEDLWVVRKGATPAFPGQRGFVGATMAEPSVILEGVDSERSELAMYSTVHGAGRVMSRSKAAGKTKWVKNPDWSEGSGKPRKIKQKVREGEISKDEVLADVARVGVVLRGGGCDEGMRAYKRLRDVLEYHGNTVVTVVELHPIGVAMAP